MNKFKSILSAIGNWFKKVGIAIGRWCKSLFVSVDGNEPKLKTLYKLERTKSILSSLISIAGGMIVGLIIMIIAGIATNHIGDLWRGFLVLISGPFFTGSSFNISFGFNASSIGSMLFRTTPILMTGLSVALAFKTGLFNIGAPGQFLMGTMASLLVAHSIPTTNGGAFWVWLLALLAGIALGAIWGAIPGLFKALLNINEVIVCIMTNWIAASVVAWVFDANGHLKNVGEGKSGYILPTRVNGVANPRLGMDLLFKGSWADGGILIAIAIAIVVYIVLNKTVFGYELRATGSNRNAARYAGMKDKRNIVLSMAIAGGLAACGASLFYLNGNTEFFWETSTSLPSEGFNGIPVALLASNNPIGVIFSAAFMSYLVISGSNLAGVTSYNEHIASLIVAVIIYFAGFSKLIKDMLNNSKAKKVTTPTIPQEETSETQPTNVAEDVNSTKEA